MPITPLPPAPRATNLGTFSTLADNFFTALPGMVTEVNALPDTYLGYARVDLTGASAVDFTGLLSPVYERTLILDAAIPTGTEQVLIQVGTSGGLITTGYSSRPIHVQSTTITQTTTTVTGANLHGVSGYGLSGAITIREQSGQCFMECFGSLIGATPLSVISGCTVPLPGPLTTIRVTRLGASNFVSGFVSLGSVQ